MKWGTLIAMAALAVNAPRLIVTYLEIDRLGLPADMEQMLLVATAIATGVVLSGGGAYIAHTIAEKPSNGWHQWVLVISYLMMLVFTVVLIAPMLMVGLRQTELTQVLTTSDTQWIWCIVAVVSVEVLAAACMVAVVLESGHVIESRERGPSLMQQVAQAATKRLVAEIEQPRQSPVMPVSTPMTEDGIDDFADDAQPAPIVTYDDTPRVVARQAEEPPLESFAALQDVLTRQDEPRQTASRQSTQDRVNQLNAMPKTTVEEVELLFGVPKRTAQRYLAQSVLTPISNGVWARQHELA